MRNWTRSGALVCAALLLLALMGCRPGNQPAASRTTEPSITETEESTLLNERQIRILAEQGLPTDYEKLTMMQKSAIAGIEDMLCYLEQRYDDRFSYVGYVADSPVEQEHLLAASEQYPNSGPVIVYRGYENGSFTYRDNYSTLLAKLLYEQALNDWIAQTIPESEFIVFSDVSYADDTLQSEQILSQASASSYILIAEAACTEEELEALVNRFGPWIREQARGERASVTLFYRVAPEYMLLANNDTYLDLLPELRGNKHFSCSVSADGVLRIS